MTTTSAPSSALPAELRASMEPAWCEVPRLVWVAARAYAPAALPGAVAVAASVCAIVVWLPSLVSLRAARQLVALDGHALVALERADRRRGIAELWWPALVGLAAIALVVLAWGALATGCAVGALHLGLGAEASAAVAAAIMAIPTVIGALVVAPVWSAGSARRMRALTSWLGAEHPSTPVWKLGALAAWPQRSGHGTALLDQLLTRRGGVVGESFVVAWPRSTELRAWYRRRFGMREHADGGLYLPPRGRV
ncbi:hypothetical protein [Nocardioides psychrotolerans]|uniref:hypothetical protein n=1 Tax=Nocardioides psychrotolerans TaxID=1005945 RepID=UPI0031384809